MPMRPRGPDANDVSRARFIAQNPYVAGTLNLEADRPLGGHVTGFRFVEEVIGANGQIARVYDEGGAFTGYRAIWPDGECMATENMYTYYNFLSPVKVEPHVQV